MTFLRLFQHRLISMVLKTKFRIALLVYSALICTACSSDNAFQDENIEGIAITIIGEDLNTVYQYDYESATDLGIQTNLSTELGINNNYLTLRQLNNTMSFFTYSNNAISLYQKDLVSGGITTFPEFYGITSERSLIWGLNTEESVYFGLYKPLGSTNLALRVVGLADFEGFDVSLEFGIDQLFEPLYSNGKLFMTYRSGGGDYKIVVYDTDQNKTIKNFEFGSTKPSILITDVGNLAVFTQNENENTFLELFDDANLLSLSKTELEFDQPFSAGPINAALSDNKLYYQYTYPQPSQVEKGPAMLDISTGENTILDVLGIIDKVKEENGYVVKTLFGQYLSSKNIFAISFVLPNGTEAELGGFILVGLDGTVLAQKNLNFIPTYFVQ